jgi:hypothetical protein
MTNPYRGLPDTAFWSRSVAWAPPGGLDPMLAAPRIHPGEPVATMGSCFAQHISRHLQQLGLDYMVAEAAPPELDPAEAAARQYGVFTARFGNVYTVRQALQLLQRAFGLFTPAEDAWPTLPGAAQQGWVDAFRPQIQPQPLASVAAVQDAARQHLAEVRRMFTQARWLVFTLGLTEAWRSRLDGAVYPVAPGVAAGAFDPALHEFVNFTMAEVEADLAALIQAVQAINPACRVILTVSPVPLIATYEPRHVLVSTTVSKAILRVAADTAERQHAHVIYFPSYEIINSAHHEGRYWADDLRQVNELGVGHAMRVFSRHFLGLDEAGPRATAPFAARAGTAAFAADVVCDEEVIEAALRAAGFGNRGSD